MRAHDPAPRSDTPDARAETIIGEAMAGDVAEQRETVRQRRAALALGRRYHRRNRNEMIRLESALAVAERRLAVLEQRQAGWHSDRTFERDLADRVLLMARIADFRRAASLAGDRLRSAGIDVTAVAGVRPATDDRGAVVTDVAAVAAYLRTRFPPVE